MFSKCDFFLSLLVLINYVFTILEFLILIYLQSSINVQDWHLALWRKAWLASFSRKNTGFLLKASNRKFDFSFIFKNFTWTYLDMCFIYCQLIFLKLQTQLFLELNHFFFCCFYFCLYSLHPISYSGISTLHRLHLLDSLLLTCSLIIFNY